MIRFDPRRPLPAAAAGVLLLALAMGGCASAAPPATPAPVPQPAGAPAARTVQPGAPGEPSRVIDPADARDVTLRGHNEADVRFMRGMFLHHAQALAMTDHVEVRTGSEAIRLMSRRIAISQASEMALMRRWLESRGEAVPPMDPSGHGAHALMPGMATPDEMARLAAARGAEFDRLFLELMIRHHEGALVMVADLLATEGAGREPELFQFLSHVDADQRAEIARMQDLLREFRIDPPRRGSE